MVGDMDNSGSLNAQIIHQISSRIRSKFAFQVMTLLSPTINLNMSTLSTQFNRIHLVNLV